jgi:hypothetical protein
MKTIAVDLDGTLIRENEYGELTPVPGAAEAMNRLHDKGYRIVIYTSRIGLAIHAGRLEEEIEFVRSVLKQFRIGYDEIFLGEKLIADAYIDDRAIPFRGDWTSAAEELDEYFHSKTF